MKQIKPQNENLLYNGRIDWDDPEAPVFAQPASFVSFRMVGKRIDVTVENHKGYWDCYLGLLLDGEMTTKVRLPEKDRATVTVIDNLPEGEHSICLFKCCDQSNIFTLYEILVDDEAVVLPSDPLPERRMEVYGDSVSAGEVSEAVEYTGKPDPQHNGEYSNSYYSFTWMTARKLNARIHAVAQGGVALLDNTGWYCGPDFVGMETLYNKIECNPQIKMMKDWDFANYTPHVVLVCIGQNDANPVNFMADDYEGDLAKNWRAHYRAFIERLRELYPNATIVLTTTILNHDKNWDEAIEQVCQELGDKKVHHFLFSNNGCGTPGHIRRPEADVMSDELSAFIAGLGNDIWND